MTSQELHDSDKWMRMSALVQQHPELLKNNLSRQYCKLFISRLCIENMIVFLLQYIGLMFSTLTPEPAPVWFAAGTATAFIFMRGLSILPGIWLGTFCAYIVVAGLKTACVFATAHALQALILLRLNYRFISPTLIFTNRWTLIKFAISSSLVTGLICFLLFYYCQQQLPNVTLPAALYLQWWLADNNGIMIIGCAIITWDMYFPDSHRLIEKNSLRRCLLYGTAATLALALALSTHSMIAACIALALLPLILLISWMDGWCGAIVALFTVALIFSLCAYMNAPGIKNMLISIEFVIFLTGLIGLSLA